MGALLIDSGGKGFSQLNAIALQRIAGDVEIDAKDVSEPLKHLLHALKENGGKSGKPTEVLIAINGERQYAFTFVVDDLAEIQEILQWTVGHE